MKNNEIEIYQDSKGAIQFRSDISEQTIWGNLNQIAKLFNVGKATISKHLKNIYKEGELQKTTTVSKMETVQIEGDRKIKRNIKYYNLDAILSVGYRVNSKQATKFRIWANSILKKYLIQGYAINKDRLKDTQEKLIQLQETIQFIANKSKKHNLKGQESKLLNLLSLYSKSLTFLDQFDNGKLLQINGKRANFELSYKKAIGIIQTIKNELITKKEATDLFGSERGDIFKGIIGNIYQSFKGKDLYDSIEAKAAHLLYFIIKDHPFSDGNKRSGSFIFIYFLDKNSYLYKDNGEKKINDNALTALALLVAESNPKEKEAIIKLIMNLITS